MFKSIELGQLIKPAKVQKCGMEKYPVLSMTMHDGLIFQSDKFTKEVASKDKSEYKVVFRNQLVVGFPIDEGVLAAQRVVDIGVVSPAYSIWNINQDQVEPEFLEYALRSNRAIEYYKAYLRGSTARRRSLPKETLLAYKLDLPSLKEQKYILRVLHQAGEIITQRTLQVKRLNQLINGRFVEMFGDVNNNRYSYKVCSLQNLIDDKVILYHLDGNHGGEYPRSKEFTETGIPYIGANCVVDGEIDFKMAKYLSPDRASKLHKGIAINNDVIFAHNATVGPVAILRTEKEKVILSTSLTAYRCNQQYIEPEYLKAYMQSEGFVNQYSVEMKQTTRNQVPITAQRKYLFMVPPHELQKQFADFVTQVDKSKVVIQKSIDKLQLLFDSLMQQYFG